MAATGSELVTLEQLKTSLKNLNAENVVTGVLPISNGGTGATTQKSAEYSVLGNPPTNSSAMSDSSRIVMSQINPTASEGVLLTRTASQFWNYIKTKTDAIYAKTTDIPDVPSITIATDAEAKGFLGY